MTQTVKPIIYSAAIFGLVLAWHLAWIINFGSSEGVLRTVSNVTAVIEDETSDSWFRHYALYYFLLFPLAFFVLAVVFAWNGRVFHRKYPVCFLAMTLAALSPGICFAILEYYIKHSL